MSNDSNQSEAEVYRRAIHDVIHELEQSQDAYGEYDHAAVDDVLTSLRGLVGDE